MEHRYRVYDMEHRYRVKATNAKGDKVEAYFHSAKHADKYHSDLWYEVDENGLLLWSMVRTTDLFLTKEAA